MIGDATLPTLPPGRLAAPPATAGGDLGSAPGPIPPVGRVDLPAGQTVQPGEPGRGVTLADRHPPAGAGGPDLVGVTLYQDAASQRYVAVIRDKSTGEVIEQIPTDRLLEIYATLRERLERIGIEIEV
jgi:hypothetical protein